VSIYISYLTAPLTLHPCSPQALEKNNEDLAYLEEFEVSFFKRKAEMIENEKKAAAATAAAAKKAAKKADKERRDAAKAAEGGESNSTAAPTPPTEKKEKKQKQPEQKKEKVAKTPEEQAKIDAIKAQAMLVAKLKKEKSPEYDAEFQKLMVLKGKGGNANSTGKKQQQQQQKGKKQNKKPAEQKDWRSVPLRKRLHNIVNSAFARVSYTEAIEILLKAIADKVVTFREEVKWGVDMGSEHERYLCEVHFQLPTIVYDYPIGFKSFYMRGETNRPCVSV
jgi:hypothetical protein